MPRKPSATVQLKARMKEPLRARLEEDAKSRGISLNAALVDRLELSVHEDEARYREFGSRATYNFMKILAMAATIAEEETGKPWLGEGFDYQTRRMAVAAMYAMMGAYGGGSPEELLLRDELSALAGMRIARDGLNAMELSDENIEKWLPASKLRPTRLNRLVPDPKAKD